MKLVFSLIAALTVMAPAAAQPASATGAQVVAPPHGIALAPAHLRAYFETARSADALQPYHKRCAAFPDLPGNRWPADLAKLWCVDHALITTDAVIAYLDQGDLAGLDAVFKRHLERHFSKTEFSELIHNDLMYFSFDPRGGEAAQRWLKAAPDSAYANAGRAVYLLGMAWKARGFDSIGNTPREKIDKMSALAREARELMGKALKIEARLLPMHAQLIEASMLESMDELAATAHKHGAAVDPGCRPLSTALMRALRPKWGGSYREMAQYAALIKPLVAQRPLLANTVVLPQITRAEELFDAKQYQQAVDTLKPLAVEANTPELHSLLARAMGYVPKHDQWEALMYLLQAARFSLDDIEVERELSRVLLNAHEMAWAVRAGERALKLQPDDPRSNFYTGSAHYYQGHYSQAEPLFLAAMENAELRPMALERLTLAMDYARLPVKAERYARLLTGEQPDNYRGWFVLGTAMTGQGRHDAALAAFETYLRVVDRADPEHAILAPQIEAGVARAKQARAADDARNRKLR